MFLSDAKTLPVIAGNKMYEMHVLCILWDTTIWDTLCARSQLTIYSVLVIIVAWIIRTWIINFADYPCMIVKLLTTNNERGKERDLTQECFNKILNTQKSRTVYANNKRKLCMYYVYTTECAVIFLVRGSIKHTLTILAPPSTTSDNTLSGLYLELWLF